MSWAHSTRSSSEYSDGQRLHFLSWIIWIGRLDRVQPRDPLAQVTVAPNPPPESISAATSEVGTVLSGRKAPKCRKCKAPMKGHSKAGCSEPSISALGETMETMSINDYENTEGANLPSGEKTSTDAAHCLILAPQDVASVEAIAHAQGLKSKTVSLNSSQPDMVAYVFGRDDEHVAGLAEQIRNTRSLVGGSWLKMSSGVAIGTVLAWVGLAYC